jgi:hypothetical protein
MGAMAHPDPQDGLVGEDRAVEVQILDGAGQGLRQRT